jgi:hypothetical protein
MRICIELRQLRFLSLERSHLQKVPGHTREEEEMSGREKFCEDIDELESQKERIGFAEDALLRKSGWEHSSDHPGCIWLWTKTIRGRKYSVPKPTAIWMERNSDIGGPQ